MQVVVIEKRIIDYVIMLEEKNLKSDDPVHNAIVCEFMYDHETNKIKVLRRQQPDEMYVTEGLARKLILHPLFSEALNRIVYDKSGQILVTGFNADIYVEGMELEEALNFSLSLDIKRK